MRPCEWCRKPTNRDDSFCSDACRKAWFDWEREMEFSFEAAQDAAYEAMEQERRDEWDAMSDQEKAEAWTSESVDW